MAEGGHSLRYFSGEDADHREYKRWKMWVQNKMLTNEKLAKEARGPFVWTLLQGRALEVVEHLSPSEYQKDGGDKVLFDLLDQRWPQKDRVDEMGEHVAEVFMLKSKEGENVRSWCARAREVFDRCHRKTGIQFPDEARGWVVLNCSGMTEEQRAVVLARGNGSLKLDDMAQAMRSCYPEFVVPKRRATAAHYAEREEEWWPEQSAQEAGGYYDEEVDEHDLHDVEAFLAEHGTMADEVPEEIYQEDEVAEVLAASWKEKRQELNRLQRSRRFAQARDVKRSLLVVGLPCTWNGGWHHLNKLHMEPHEINEKIRLVKLFVNFSADLAQMQLDRGGRVLLEHPSGSNIWTLPKLAALRRSMFEVITDMCCFDFVAPGGLPIQKRTRLLVSHANMRSLQRQCQGTHQHQKGGTASRFVGQCPPAFIRAVLRTVPEYRDTAACLVQAGTDAECLAAARVQQLNAEKREEMLQSLKRLHVNLGHPSASNLMRVLKHGGASKEAVELAKELECDVCKAQAAPKSPPPAQTNRATQFNQRIGIDVKYLPGWKPNQRIPAVNIVDFASSFQIVVPLHGRETSETIRKALLERWVSWAGTPQEIALDPAQTNLSDALTVPQELAGSKICITAAEAHWQLGKVEAARMAVIELQDSKALRLALAARPRKVQAFEPGIKNLIDSGALQSRQYVDLVPQGPPPAAEPAASPDGDAQMPQAPLPSMPPTQPSEQADGVGMATAVVTSVRLLLSLPVRVSDRCSDRIMGSRFVCTWKQEELIASFRWKLMLGDIKGAFLASGDLPAKYRPLYARLPAGGIPGVPCDALIEVIGHVYGLNDAPSAWYKTLDRALLEVGFERSRLDRCLYFMREGRQLTGIFGIHVDDSVTGGQGQKYERALSLLKEKFEFRKWRVRDGDFCGARYTQSEATGEIVMTQESFVQKVRPLHLSRQRALNKGSELTEEETRCLRAINGSLNWLATQSRPDLSTQVSFSQQAFPRPKVSDAIAANQAIRRAKQHASMPIVYRTIPVNQLTIMCHSDAAYANGRGGATQAGYVVSFVDNKIHEGETVRWTPAFWKSYRLPRVVNSTLSAEAQAMTMATGMCEWSLLLVSEAIDGAETWAWIAQGLPQAERRQTQHSMVRSFLAGEGAELWRDAVAEFRQLRSDLQASGAWDQVSHYYCERWGLASDGSKRSRDEAGTLDRDFMESAMEEDYLLINENGSPRRLGSAPTPMMSGSAPRGPPPPVPITDTTARTGHRRGSASSDIFSSGTGSPLPPHLRLSSSENESEPVNHRPAAKASPPLPDGVHTMSQWGDTLVDFGKLKGQGWSYEGVASNTSKEIRGYRKWILDHVNQMTGPCKDLGNYLLRMQADGRIPATPDMIPGTESVRSYVSRTSAKHHWPKRANGSLGSEKGFAKRPPNMAAPSPMAKSTSLPSLWALGTTAPKLAGHEKNQSLRYALGSDKGSAYATFRKPDVSERVMGYVWELQTPGWRQRATEPRADPDPTEEDLLPSNQRHPRVAPAWLKHEKQVLRFYAFFQEPHLLQPLKALCTGR
ncbi:Copia protein [Symbiodinium microadriaticum]|uniref:Copia protein n=1 Tax=Symbiodinium microadriaticum TaxID=2951 RepID=A0A1Q9C5R0_SYMMI|nr:Copia protein [Symbiodinium microadriaticum]CAE7795640.1 GIP [Symbiodinium microadriaticum]